MFYVTNLLPGVNFLSYDHTPELASNVWTIRLLGNFPVSQVAECRCMSLAGNSAISLAGNEGSRTREQWYLINLARLIST